jgi:predicted O-linked N-acetylglucosamine transferase (SPINDLY family)
MDWFVSNDRFETPAAAGHYSERLFLLHGLPTLAYYHAPSRTGEPVSRSDYGFDADETLYLCPQTSFKIHPDMDALIAGVLRGDPRGCVVLIDFFRPWSDELRQRFERSLCDVAGRIRFVSKMRANDYLGLLEMSDVVLDTVHFNGMNSSLEAFAMGTPVVTWPQETQRSRHTFGMYMSMGMIDCVARDALDYVAIALRLGTDRAHAEMVRKRIAERRHVLFEDSRVIAEFERFFVAAIAERFGSVTPLGSGA